MCHPKIEQMMINNNTPLCILWSPSEYRWLAYKIGHMENHQKELPSIVSIHIALDLVSRPRYKKSKSLAWLDLMATLLTYLFKGNSGEHHCMGHERLTINKAVCFGLISQCCTKDKLIVKTGRKGIL
jgi:hypothetical protein